MCSLNLSDFSDLAQVVIAIANLFLAGYVLFYQIRKDKKSESETAKLNEQNIKLQWFKDLIIQPNIHTVNHFYEQLNGIKARFTSDDLTLEAKEEINNLVKAEMAVLRKEFVDVMLLIDKQFYDQLLANIDGLTDSITNAIFDEDLKLSRANVYEKHIGNKIAYSKNQLISQLYNYKGIAVQVTNVKS